jgi:hypothetical protein
MPQLQVVDFGEDPLATAARKFGSGFGETMNKNYEETKRNDAVSRVLSQYEPGISKTDFLKRTLNERDLPLETRAGIFDTFNKLQKEEKEEAAKLEKEQQLTKSAQTVAMKHGFTPEEAANIRPEHVPLIAKMNKQSTKIDPKRVEAFTNDPRFLTSNDPEYYKLAAEYEIPTSDANALNTHRKKTQDKIDADTSLTAKERMQYYSPYVQKIEEDADQAQNRQVSFARAKELLATGKVGPDNWNNFLASYFKEDSPIGNLLQHPENAEFQRLAYESIIGTRQDFGVRLTDSDLKVVQNKIISTNKTPEANMRIINFTSLQDRGAIEKARITNEILEENNGIPPTNFRQILNKRMKGSEYAKELENAAIDVMNMDQEGNTPEKITLFDPVTEKEYSIPSEKMYDENIKLMIQKKGLKRR